MRLSVFPFPAILYAAVVHLRDRGLREIGYSRVRDEVQRKTGPD